MAHSARSPLRFLAPIALIAAGLLFFLVLSQSVGSDSAGTDTVSEEVQDGSGGGQGQPQREVYEVKTGDTLDGIAEKTGVSLERLQKLNPTLDPQSLITGQRIRLQPK